jgi:hypothetical protein
MTNDERDFESLAKSYKHHSGGPYTLLRDEKGWSIYWGDKAPPANGRNPVHSGLTPEDAIRKANYLNELVTDTSGT